MASPAQFKLPCGHSQCGACLTVTLRIAVTDSSMLPLRCCGLDVETTSLARVLLDEGEAQVSQLNCHFWQTECLVLCALFSPI
jgi:hypothetical protein